MRKTIIGLIMIVAFNANSASKISTQVQTSTESDSIEFQMGQSSLTPMAQDYTAWKMSVSFWKHFENWSVGPQVSYLQIPETGSQAVSIRTDSIEGMVWGRYRQDATPNWNVYGGMALGVRTDFVKTRIYGDKSDSFGEPYGLSAAALGTQYKFPSMMISFELQYIYAPSYENKEVAVLIGTGVFF